MSFISSRAARGSRWLVAGVLACAVAAVCFTAAAQVPVVGGQGTSLKELVGSPTLVTVVLKLKDAQDPNVRLVDLGPDYIAVVTKSGQRNSYLLSDIKEIRVQQGEVEAPKRKLNLGRSLSPAEQSIVARTIEQLQQVYDTSSNDQMLKVMTAAVMVAGREAAANVMDATRDPSGERLKKIDEAHEYLKQLAATNDPLTSVLAAKMLWLAGDSEAAKPVVAPNIKSPNRKARILAAELAGLVKATEVQEELMAMAKDRSADVAAPAALSLAMMGNKDVIPILIGMISDLNELKGRAAVKGLTVLGGTEVIDALHEEIQKAQNLPRFRMALVLYELHDPLGQDLLRHEYLEVPTLARSAALLLASRGDAEGMDYLRGKLAERFDASQDNYIFRAHAGGALVEGDDRSGVTLLQEALREDDPAVQIAVCETISQVGTGYLLPVVQPALESGVPHVVLMAGFAALSIADADLHERIIATSEIGYQGLQIQMHNR